MAMIRSVCHQVWEVRVRAVRLVEVTTLGGLGLRRTAHAAKTAWLWPSPCLDRPPE